MHWIFSFTLAVHVTASPGAYYNLLTPKIFKEQNLDESAIFGFSVSYMPQLKRLVVGAPLANDIGKVYTCDLEENKNACQNVAVNLTRYGNPKYNDTNYWLGATVKGSGDYFVTCSPLAVDDDISYKPLGIGTYGRCYKYSKIDNVLTELPTLTPSQRKTKYTVKNTKDRVFYDKYEETMDSFGWSIDIAGNTVTIGSPAVISGRVVLMNPARSTLNKLIAGYETSVSYNFGYSLASGMFSSKKLVQAIGSPYGTYGYGSVTLMKDQFAFAKLKIPRGPKVGSMFGAVLCTVSLATGRAGIRNADLLVGSPTYADEDAYNVGAVFVYIMHNGHNQVVFKRKIVGKQDGSMFGSAIVSVGDQNGDEIDDIAIAAPYENDRGAVYLFSGADIMNSEKSVSPVQKIEPHLPMRTFGHSLAALEDYDDNGCNELAIGAPDSNAIVVYKCPATFTIKLANFPRTLVNGKIQKVQACFTTNYPEKPEIIDAKIKVTVKIEHSHATLAKPEEGDFEVLLNRKNNKYCKHISLDLPANGNYAEEIVYKLSAQLLDDENIPKYKLSDHSLTTIKGTIRASECGDRDCKPDLKYMKTAFTGNVEKLEGAEHFRYVVGSSDVINARVLVENTGEVAYDACAHIEVEGATVLPSATGCSIKQRDPTLLECRPKQALRRSSSPWQSQNISLNAASLTNKNKKITFRVSIYNRCVVSDTDVTADVTATEDIELISDTDFDVSSHTDPSQDDDMMNLTRSDIAMKKKFQHIYTIINKGITNWIDINVNVTTDKQDFVTRNVVIQENGGQTCTVESETDENFVHSCVINKLNKGSGITIKVLMQADPEKFIERIVKENLMVRSGISVALDKTKTASITSELRLIEADLPLWIIVVASIIALILLFILVLILRECGFLKRTNKEQLKQARKSFRRQTMMRQSMMNRPGSEDLDELVASTSQETDNKKKDRRLVVSDL